MKKIALATLFAIFATAAMADSVTLEGQSIDGKKGQADQGLLAIGVKADINKSFAADVRLESLRTQGTDAVSSKVEGGLTGTHQLFGPVSGYVRGALGENYTGTTNYGYYSVEPGVKAALGSGVTAQVGWRFRDAVSNQSVNQFTSRTWRAGLAYDITPKDQIGARYDWQRGDTGQNANIVTVNYTRGF